MRRDTPLPVGPSFPAEATEITPLLVCIFDGIRELGRVAWIVEAHVEHLCAIFHRVVNGPQNVGIVTGSVRVERLEWHDLRLRRDQMHNASGHSAMAECRIL